MGIVTWLSLQILDLFVLDTSKTINLAFLFVVSTSVGLIAYAYISFKFKLDQIESYKRFFTRLIKLPLRN
jgi:hypothetical protein